MSLAHDLAREARPDLEAIRKRAAGPEGFWFSVAKKDVPALVTYCERLEAENDGRMMGSEREIVIREFIREVRERGLCKCDPPGCGEEWCLGICEYRERIEALETENAALRTSYASDLERNTHNAGVTATLITDLQKENTTLRAALAKVMPCRYCGVESIGLCPYGFPGCALADDIASYEETAAAALHAARSRIEALEAALRDLLPVLDSLEQLGSDHGILVDDPYRTERIAAARALVKL